MSFPVYPSTPVTGASIVIPPNAQMRDCTVIALNNYSTYGLNLVLPGNKQDFLLPQQGKYLASDDFYNDDIKIYPIQMLQQAFSGISQTISITGYEKGERTPPPGTTYQLGTVVFVANPITTVGGVANQVISDDKPVGFPLLEATVMGDSFSSILLSQEGLLTLGSSARPGGLAVLGAGSQTFLEGDLSVGSNVSVDASDGSVRANKFLFPVGSFSAISSFKQAITTTLTFYNHNLGVKPDGIMMQLLGTTTTAATVKYDDLTMDANQVKMIASTNCTVQVWCFKQ